MHPSFTSPSHHNIRGTASILRLLTTVDPPELSKVLFNFGKSRDSETQWKDDSKVFAIHNADEPLTEDLAA